MFKNLQSFFFKKIISPEEYRRQFKIEFDQFNVINQGWIKTLT